MTRTPRTILKVLQLEDRSVPAFLVTNTFDSGLGSLRQAILDANSQAGQDTIAFAIPGSGSHAIALSSALPAITDPVVMDGWTQAGFSGTPLIELHGSGGGWAGVNVAASGSVIRGLAITGMGGAGICVNASNVWLAGNYVGLDPSGAVRGNNGSGIFVQGNGALVGTDGDGINDAIERNVVSGNGETGVFVQGATGVIVRGDLIGTDAAGTADRGNALNGVLFVDGANNGLVQGNVISGNDFSGVNIINASNNAIRGNVIGTNAAATAAIANSGGGAGVVVQGNSTGNTIGGLGTDRNVISGNAFNGVWLLGGGVTNTVVRGNFIGLNGAGAGCIGNNGNGILITGAPGTTVDANVVSGNSQTGVVVDGAAAAVVTGNLIGTDAAGAKDFGNALNGLLLQNGASGASVSGNVISGNDFSGINIISASGNTFRANMIGTNSAGSIAIPNSGGGAGIVLQGSSSGNVIGGTNGADRNIISGNAFSGVWLLGSGVVNTTVLGNSIGASASGGSLGNTGYGVRIESNSSGNTIGGTAAGAGNTITANNAGGIVVFSGSGNSLRGNSISANGGIGIDLGGDGVTPNDAGDVDGGANGRQNFPSLTSATVTGTTIAITGALNSSPNSTFTLDFFANAAGTSTTSRDGRIYLGSAAVTTGGDGNASFTVNLTGIVPANPVVSSTATAADGSTSEVSLGVSGYTVPSPTAVAGPDLTSQEGGPVQFDGSASVDPAGAGLIYTWDFGDGCSASGSKPVHVYGDNGVYTAILDVRDGNGLESVDSVIVTVSNVAPTPTITSVSNLRLEGTPITVMGSASDPAGSNDTLTFTWTVFKAGATNAFAQSSGVNLTSFNFTPDHDGDYQIVLMVADEDGGSNSVAQTVHVTHVLPVPSIDSVSSPLQEGTAITMTGSATDAVRPPNSMLYTWNVYKDGNASPYASSAGVNNTTFLFTPGDNGSYRIVLTVDDQDGGVASVEQTISVANVAPTPSIVSVSSPQVEGTAITAMGSATDPAGANDTLSYTWQVFKNGTAYGSGAGPNLNFTPNDNGSYRIVLTVSDEDGGTTSVEQTISVANVAPTPTVVSISSPQVEGTAITAMGSATDPAGANDTLSYTWQVFKNGTSYGSGAGPNLSFTPNDNGSYRIVLTVSDEDGGSTSVEQTISVANVAPQNVFAGSDQTVASGSTVSLNGSFTDPGSLDNDTYLWTVVASNGQAVASGRGQSYSFVPSAAGAYTVTFTVTDKDGGSGSDVVVVTVTGPVLQVAMNGPSKGFEGEPVQFTSSHTNPLATDCYLWTVTNNGAPVAVTGNHSASFAFTPNEPGDYQIKLIINTASGSASASASLTITAPAGVVLLPSGRLVIRGTDGADTIQVGPGPGAGGIQVKLNGVQYRFKGVTEIAIYTNAGNDDVRLADGISQTISVFAGSGSDRVKGPGGEVNFTATTRHRHSFVQFQGQDMTVIEERPHHQGPHHPAHGKGHR